MRRCFAIVAVIGAVLSSCVSGGGPGIGDDTGVIEVFGPWRGVEADRFGDVLRAFEQQSGFEVQYIGSANFVVDLTNRTGDGNRPPDVAIVPQAGLIRELVADEHVVPIGAATSATITANFGDENAELGSVDGTQFAIPYRITVKSLVWFRPQTFADNGWTVPESLDELEGLVADIVADGASSPWCLGIESGTATGWVATDWIEDLVVRSIGPDGYARWVEGDIAFSAPEIEAAFDGFDSLVLQSGRVAGGLRTVVETPVSEAILPLLDDPAGCVLHRQSDVAVNWLPDGTSIGPTGDIDFFVLPGGRPTDVAPLVIGADQIVQFRDDIGVNALMDYLAGTEAAAIWARQGGFLSANEQVDIDEFPDGYLRVLTDIVEAAPTVVLDASDQLPSAIGSGLLWTSITDWVAGAQDYDTFATTIDDAIRSAEPADP